MRKIRFTLALLSWISLMPAISGCSTAPANSIADAIQPVDHITPLLENRFGEQPDIVDAEQLHHLTAAQVQKFESFLAQPRTAELPLIEGLANYLQLVTDQFSYGEKTQPARETLSSGAGNCMSLAVLTTALAEHVGVEVSYQLINSNPVFHWEGDLIRKGQHLRSILLRPSLNTIGLALSRGGIRIDYFPGPSDRYVRQVARPEYLSMYYNNLAVNALEHSDYNRVWWLAQESLRQQPNNVDALNAIALLYRRTGDDKHAEQLYKAVINKNPGAVVILRNYRTLLRSQKRDTEALEISEKLAGLEGANPIDWLVAGSEEFHNSNYSDAIRFFKKAIKIAPYMHEAHLGLAQSYHALSNTRQTRRHLELALQNAERASTRSLYEGKLVALRQSK